MTVEGLNKRPSWDEYFLRLAYGVASRSECLDKQVGCVITDRFGRIIGTGYNGFPAGAKNPCEHLCAKEQGKPCGMVHAELNAMLYTDMTRAYTMYLTLPPCSACLRHIVNTPITSVVIPAEFKGTAKAQELFESGLAVFVDPKITPILGAIKAVKELAELKANVGLGLVEALGMIQEYHQVLGYPSATPESMYSDRAQMQQFRELTVAINQEVAELCDSLPWKPWRKLEDQPKDLENALVELVDIFFFLGSFLELLGISPERFEAMLKSKLEENYNRIRKGYNTPKEAM